MEAQNTLQSQPLPLLAASGLAKSFGGIKAVDNAELEVAKGIIHCLNAAKAFGKTTYC